MRAEIKAIAGYTCRFEEIMPADSEKFCETIIMHIGVKGGAGADHFLVHVCTPSWLEHMGREPKFGRFYLIIDIFDRAVIRGFLEDYVSKLEGADWEDLSLKLSRVFEWEFEDYVPYSQSE